MSTQSVVIKVDLGDVVDKVVEVLNELCVQREEELLGAEPRLDLWDNTDAELKFLKEMSERLQQMAHKPTSDLLASLSLDDV